MNKIVVTKKETGDTKEVFQESVVVAENSELALILDEETEVSFTVAEKVEARFSILGNASMAKMSFHLQEASKVVICSFMEQSSQVFLCLEGEDAEAVVHQSILAAEELTSKIVLSHEAPRTKSMIYHHALTNEKGVSLVVDASIPKGMTECSCNQDNKIIALGNAVTSILPNLFIDEYDVVANHSAYIGKFPKEELFYLETRGLTREQSYTLLAQAFLVGNFEFSDEKREEFKEKITRYMEVRKNES